MLTKHPVLHWRSASRKMGLRFNEKGAFISKHGLCTRVWLDSPSVFEEYALLIGSDYCF